MPQQPPPRVLPTMIVVNTCQYDEDGDVVMKIDQQHVNWIKPVEKKKQ
jgi:hypothetical protein